MVLNDQDPANTAGARDDDRHSVGATAGVLRLLRAAADQVQIDPQSQDCTATDSAGTVTTYDARGRVITRESTSGGTTTVYDVGGRNVGRFTNR
jgi:YD repeat-containing protein